MVEKLPGYEFPPNYAGMVEYTKSDKAKNAAKKGMHRKVRQRMRVFLRAYVDYGSIAKASDATGIARSTHVSWVNKWDFYKEAYEQARVEMVEQLESHAHKRATKGWKQPVYYQGEQVGHERRYSDQLLMFLLRGNKPDKYANKEGGNYASNNTTELKLQTVIVQIREDQPEYAQFLRDSAVNSDSGSFRKESQQRRLEVSSPSITDGSGHNGHHRPEVPSGDSDSRGPSETREE